jgi:hypothetical protein
VIQLTGVPADDLAAREPCHFLEDRVDKKNLIGIVCNDDTVIQRFKNGLHLLQRLWRFVLHEITHLADPSMLQPPPLIRLASKAIKHLLDVHIVGDKLRALVEHAPQHSLPALVNECDFVEIHDAPSSLGCAVCPLPTCSQFLDPRRDETTLQGPQFFLRRVGDRNLQHPFLLRCTWIMQMQGQKNGSAPWCATAGPT